MLNLNSPHGASTPAQKRKTFSADDDAALRRCVGSLGRGNWPAVSSAMANFTTRQVRDRYNNYLDPSLNTGPWSHEEDLRLLHLVLTLGRCWSKIAESFDHRSPVNIKNHWMLMRPQIVKTWTKRSKQLYPGQDLPVPLIDQAAPRPVPAPVGAAPAPIPPPPEITEPEPAAEEPSFNCFMPDFDPAFYQEQEDELFFCDDY